MINPIKNIHIRNNENSRLRIYIFFIFLLILSNLSCLEYRVEIVFPEAELRHIPKFHSKSFYKPQEGSIWKVVSYKHGWVKVKGPLQVDSSIASKYINNIEIDSNLQKNNSQK